MWMWLSSGLAASIAALDAATGEEDIVFLAGITDGLENASEHSTESIKQLLKAREEKGWSVVFVGANQDTMGTAAEFGVDKRGRAYNFDASMEIELAGVKGDELRLDKD
jgi:hypothetical protein